jgi:DNA-binding LytR/AlgR family response regulator
MIISRSPFVVVYHREIQTSIFELTIQLSTFKPACMSNQFVFFRQKGALKKLDIDAIIVMETADNYLKIVGRDDFFTIRATLDSVLNLMPAKKFLRVHRQYAVSVDYIDKIDRDHLILGDHTTSIPVSKQHYPEIIKQIVILDAVIPKTKNRGKITKTRFR